MSSFAAPRCRHIKFSGTQCGSPALRNKKFCFYHEQAFPMIVECYSEGKYSTGEIVMPAFEDAHSIQTVVRQVVQLLLQKRIERKTARLLLYGLQIASSNLKRIELEKPQPEQVVTDVEKENYWAPPIAVADATISNSTITDSITQELAPNAQPDANTLTEPSDEELPPGTIQACYKPYRHENRTRRSGANTAVRATPRRSLLCFLRDGDGESVSIFKGEFPHAIELLGNRHGNFRASSLNAIEHVPKAVNFHVESDASANVCGEFGKLGCNRLLIVKKDLDNAIRDRCKHVRRFVGNRDRFFESENLGIEL